MAASATWRAVLLGLALALVGAVPAYAETPVNDARVTADLAIADAYWHAAPDCPGGYHVWEAAPQAERADGEIAVAWATQSGCDMWLTAPVLQRWTSGLPRATATGYDSAELCLLVVHERGHSLGYGHSSNPRDVMFADPADPSLVPGCEAQDFRAPHAKRHHRRRRHR